jgi:hypothetical protein
MATPPLRIQNLLPTPTISIQAALDAFAHRFRWFALLDSAAIITVAGQVSEVMDHYGLLLTMVNQAHMRFVQMIGAQDEIFEVVKGLRKKPKSSRNCETGPVASEGEHSEEE